jgi:hypothetical protein
VALGSPGGFRRSNPALARALGDDDPLVRNLAAIRNGATMHEVREFAGHSGIRTTELYFVRNEEDADDAACRIQIRVIGSQGPTAVP